MTRRRVIRRRADAGGHSLVEVLVALALLSVSVTAIVSGLFTMNRSTSVNQRVQFVDAALVTYGEILRTGVDYRPCGSPGAPYSNINDAYRATSEAFFTGSSSPDHPLWRKPNTMLIEVVGVESWNPATGQFEDRGAGLRKCLNPDTGAQRITYRILYPVQPNTATPIDSWPIDRTGQVVKRKPGVS